MAEQGLVGRSSKVKCSRMYRVHFGRWTCSTGTVCGIPSYLRSRGSLSQLTRRFVRKSSPTTASRRPESLSPHWVTTAEVIFLLTRRVRLTLPGGRVRRSPLLIFGEPTRSSPNKIKVGVWWSTSSVRCVTPYHTKRLLRRAVKLRVLSRWLPYMNKIGLATSGRFLHLRIRCLRLPPQVYSPIYHRTERMLWCGRLPNSFPE